MPPPTFSDAGLLSWRLKRVNYIEDLQNAVEGAGYQVTQMSREAVTGTLAYSHWNGIVFSSGLLQGKFCLQGPVSKKFLTIGTGLILDGRCQHWLRDIEAGTVGVFGAGDDHDAIYSGRTLFIAATLPEDRLLVEAEQHGIVIDHSDMRTGLCARPMSAEPLRFLKHCLLAAHRRKRPPSATGASCDESILISFLNYFGRPPRVGVGLPPLRGYERIVARARDWIHAHLEEPMHIDEIATAALTSRRTLYRAFLAVMEESPQSYIRRLRLHRIRADLASDAEAKCTVSAVANHWGVSELGRLSARYRALFGEVPSETMKKALPGEAANLAQTA